MEGLQVVVEELREALDLDVPCSDLYHAVIKVTPAVFRASTYPRGLQADGEGGWLDLANCRRCHSTLAIIVEAVH